MFENQWRPCSRILQGCPDVNTVVYDEFEPPQGAFFDWCLVFARCAFYGNEEVEFEF